jgi:hypothetical protein
MGLTVEWQLARPMRTKSLKPPRRSGYAVARTMLGRFEMIEQLAPIPWSDEDSDEDEMIDFVVAASEMLEELLARPQPNYLRSRLVHLHKQSLAFLEDHWLH